MALQSNVFQIFWDAQISVSIEWNETKSLYKWYIQLETTMVQFLCTFLTRGRCNSVFLQNSFDSDISASVAWNRSKFYMEYMYNKTWHWYNFYDFYLTRGRYNCVSLKTLLIIVTWLLLHGISQNLIYNILIIWHYFHAICIKIAHSEAL